MSISSTYEVDGFPGGKNITVSERKILECLLCTRTTRHCTFARDGICGRSVACRGHLAGVRQQLGTCGQIKRLHSFIHSFLSSYLKGKVYRSSVISADALKGCLQDVSEVADAHVR